jgi:radical SAM protein with 4Fe4S-binding SPASM domain
MPDDTLLKTSAFVYYTGSTVCNDLTNLEYGLGPADVEILRRLALSPAGFEAVTAADPSLRPRLQFLVDQRLVVPASLDEAGEFIPHRVDIETCRQCNARCKFCPQSVSPKSRGVMPLELFELALSALGESTPQWVALNHYGEPLLDPFFRERVRMLREKGYPLNLFTNGTLMKDSLVDFLGEGGLYDITFNFPSVEPHEWCQLMQLPERFYWNARRAVERCLTTSTANRRGVTISVNAHTGNQEERAARICDHFSAMGPVRLILEDTNSRTDSVVNELVRIDSHPAGRYYSGCDRVASHLHISWEGKVFLCCQDYEQRFVLGDLRESDIPSIMRSDYARHLRAQILGLAPMRAGLICLTCNKLRTCRFPADSAGAAQ